MMAKAVGNDSSAAVARVARHRNVRVVAVAIVKVVVMVLAAAAAVAAAVAPEAAVVAVAAVHDGYEHAKHDCWGNTSPGGDNPAKKWVAAIGLELSIANYRVSLLQ